MSQRHHHHHHGNVLVGRIMVAVGCLLIFWADWLVFKRARVEQIPSVENSMATGFLWFVVGAGGMFARIPWMRYLTLAVLYFGSFTWFFNLFIIFFSDSSTLESFEKTFVLAMFIYLYVSLVFTHSRHIRRLTSRAYE